LAIADQLEEARVRLKVSEDQLSMAIDQERSGDTVVSYEQDALVVMDAATSDRLAGRTLDIDETRRRFVLK
jgi:hypothetical protein